VGRSSQRRLRPEPWQVRLRLRFPRAVPPVLRLEAANSARHRESPEREPSRVAPGRRQGRWGHSPPGAGPEAPLRSGEWHSLPEEQLPPPAECCCWLAVPTHRRAVSLSREPPRVLGSVRTVAVLIPRKEWVALRCSPLPEAARVRIRVRLSPPRLQPDRVRPPAPQSRPAAQRQPPA
jgi:hypothetical protein